MPHRILLVAPHIAGDPFVAAKNELIQAVVNTGMAVTSLIANDMTGDDILRELRRGSYTMMVVMAHGGPEGIQINGADMLSIDDLAQAVVGLELLLLLSCETLEVASVIADTTDVDVVAALKLLGLPEAYRFAAAMLTHLARGVDNWSAYELARPTRETNIRYVPSYRRRHNNNMTPSADHDRPIDQLGNRVTALERTTDRHATLLEILMRPGPQPPGWSAGQIAIIAAIAAGLFVVLFLLAIRVSP